MPLNKALAPLADHPRWLYFLDVYSKQCFPQVLLLVSPDNFAQILTFAENMLAASLCVDAPKICGVCKSCRLLKSQAHSDVYYIQPEKAGGVITIEQIRALLEVVFISPKLSTKRIILIRHAERMHVAAANALLKILEEPPDFAMFILVAEYVSSLPLTLLSRCQQWSISEDKATNASLYPLYMGEQYATDSTRGQIFAQLPGIIQDLLDLVSGKILACSVAARWLSFEFNDLMWLMYLLNSQMICDKLLKFPNHNKPWVRQLHMLAQCFALPTLFRQLDVTCDIIKKLRQNISINQLLALENILFAISEYKHAY